ncbi:MAG: glycosyltransferase family 2 protein [Janthinobacterium lividum]
MITVSIVISTYKRPARLREALLSCIEQTYLPHEIVVGDDSPDNLTKQVVVEMQKQTSVLIRHIHNKPFLKQAANTNMLFSSATGDKVVLLHDDDLLMPEALATMVQCFNDNPDAEVVFGKQHIISDDGIISDESSVSYNTDYYRSKEYEGAVLTPLEAGIGQQFPNNAYMVNTSIVRKIQFRTHDDLNIPLGNGCEYDFGARIGLQGHKMYFIDQFLAKYRISEVSMSKSKTDDAAYQAFRVLKDIPVHSERSKKIKDQRLYDKAPIAITQAVNLRKRKDALSIFFSPWYAKRIISLGGIKRILYIMFG